MKYIVFMRDVHLSGIDLNLLPALDALLLERHVTRAAKRIGLTQSAMSHALARLRTQTGDALLVRTGDGFVLTSRAEAMRIPLARTLGDVQALFAAPTFDPRKEKRTFRIGTSDYSELVLLPPLVAQLTREAPGISLHLHNRSTDFATDLAEGRLDLAIAPRAAGDEGAGLMATKLWTDRFVCVVRRGHPFARPARRGKPRLSLASFVAASHALIAPRGEGGSYTDDALATLGLSRTIALRVPHFLLAPHVIARSDLVLTLATRIAFVMAPLLDLVELEPPSELGAPEFGVSALWHARTHEDPGNRWLRERIATVARQLEPREAAKKVTRPRATAPKKPAAVGRRSRRRTDGA